MGYFRGERVELPEEAGFHVPRQVAVECPQAGCGAGGGAQGLCEHKFTIRDNNVKRTKRGGGEVNSVKNVRNSRLSVTKRRTTHPPAGMRIVSRRSGFVLLRGVPENMPGPEPMLCVCIVIIKNKIIKCHAGSRLVSVGEYV